MASSNRHWPSMFKSKPCNPHHQWQHDINSSLISTACHRSTPYTSGGCDERSPEPKPRWNPKPEQIRILEGIFNSGMVNPPRDEIRRIRAQLQEYGQVGDANVFYWFQNRKSRSKHKLRHLHNHNNTSSKNLNNNNNQETPQPQNITTAPNSSSSSSSDKSSPKELIPPKVFSIGFSNVTDVVPNSHSPTTSVNQAYFHSHIESTTLAPPPPLPVVVTAPSEAFFFPVQHHHHGTLTSSSSPSPQGFCFSELSNVVQATQPQPHGPCTSLLLSEIMSLGSSSSFPSKKEHQEHDERNMKIMQHTSPEFSLCVTPTPTACHTSAASVVPSIPTTTVTAPSPLNTQLQGIGMGDGADTTVSTAKSTVFINDVAFEVAVGPFNVREAFGDDAVLIHSSGQPVLTNHWGLTLHSLQHGASYYLI